MVAQLVKNLPAMQVHFSIKETLEDLILRMQWRNPGSIPGSGRSPGERIGYPLQYSWASLMAQMVKNPPAMPETWVQFLGWDDPLEKGMETHSSILAWRIPWTEDSDKLWSMGSQTIGHDWVAKHSSFSTYRRQVEDMGGGLFWEGLIGSCSVNNIWDHLKQGSPTSRI